MSRKLTVLLVLVALVCQSALAQVQLPDVIGDSMVLQRGQKVPIWGKAVPGQKVTVKGSWQWLGNSAEADAEGNWKVMLNPPKPGGPYTMTIKGKKGIITLKDILCGEVWLCSGQSNMEMPLDNVTRGVYEGVDDYKDQIAQAHYPDIRLFTPDVKKKYVRGNTYAGQWSRCNSETIKTFSATAYYFARALQKELKVPVGLMNASYGATYIEEWMSRSVIESDCEFKDITLKTGHSIAKHYDSQIAPLIPYGIKGVIWYQGEGNVERPQQYYRLFPALINSWRCEWDQGSFPFYYVQIAPCSKHYDKYGPSSAAVLRDAQLQTLSTADTGMAVTVDICKPNARSPQNIHPSNKQEVGRRLALWALAKTYQKDIPYSGPIYKSMKLEDSKVRIYFESADNGLLPKGGELTDFVIAGKDKQFVKAKAVIDGSCVVIFSETVPEPIAVRYGWGNAVTPNLFNSEGLPASPFRTDSW